MSNQFDANSRGQPEGRVACLGIFIVMGVSGSGKTTIGRALAEKTGGIFLDADDFHSPANRAKMSAGIPLMDEDRLPWLDALNAALRSHQSTNPQPVFLACSALREDYRLRISSGLVAVRFIYLEGSKDLIRARISARPAHFMPASLLDSQFATLEVPKDAIVANVDAPVEVIVERLVAEIGLKKK
jgi:gluconokinase